jgi:hypothetical protein
MIKSMKNASDPMGNRTRDLVACSAVIQPTVQLPTPSCVDTSRVYLLHVFLLFRTERATQKSFHT